MWCFFEKCQGGGLFYLLKKKKEDANFFQEKMLVRYLTADNSRKNEKKVYNYLSHVSKRIFLEKKSSDIFFCQKFLPKYLPKPSDSFEKTIFSEKLAR